MGRVLLADLPQAELDVFLGEAELEAFTDRTVTAADELRAILADVRSQGWALVDEELEVGLRSVAAPIRGANGRALAAINVSAAVPRVSLEELRTRCLLALLETAGLISTGLARGVTS